MSDLQTSPAELARQSTAGRGGDCEATRGQTSSSLYLFPCYDLKQLSRTWHHDKVRDGPADKSASRPWMGFEMDRIQPRCSATRLHTTTHALTWQFFVFFPAGKIIGPTANARSRKRTRVAARDNKGSVARGGRKRAPQMQRSKLYLVPTLDNNYLYFVMFVKIVCRFGTFSLMALGYPGGLKTKDSSIMEECEQRSISIDDTTD